MTLVAVPTKGMSPTERIRSYNQSLYNLDSAIRTVDSTLNAMRAGQKPDWRQVAQETGVQLDAAMSWLNTLTHTGLGDFDVPIPTPTSDFPTMGPNAALTPQGMTLPSAYSEGGPQLTTLAARLRTAKYLILQRRDAERVALLRQDAGRGRVAGLSGRIPASATRVAENAKHRALVMEPFETFAKAVRDRTADPRPPFQTLMASLQAYARTLVGAQDAPGLAEVWLYWGSFRIMGNAGFPPAIRNRSYVPQGAVSRNGWSDIGVFWHGVARRVEALRWFDVNDAPPRQLGNDGLGALGAFDPTGAIIDKYAGILAIRAALAAACAYHGYGRNGTVGGAIKWALWPLLFGFTGGGIALAIAAKQGYGKPLPKPTT